MAFYKLSRQRVLHVLNSPRRIEEGVAPRTVAMMVPASLKTVGKKETWNQEIWAMVEDAKDQRIIISAWRYPGMTKPKSEVALEQMRKQYEDYKESEN